MEKIIISVIYFSLLIIFSVSFIKYRLYRLNHNSLLVQPLFWASIAVPLITCLFLGSLVWIEKLHSFSITTHGYQRFIEISKLPLLILAAAVPLASIVNNLHRTIQTEKQINESEQKNKTDIYYAHVKFQTDYFKTLPETVLSEKISLTRVDSKFYENEIKEYSKIIKVAYPLALYHKLYPNSNPINGVEYEANREHTKTILKSWANINKTLTNIEKLKSTLSREKTYNDIELLLEQWYLAEKEIIRLCSYIAVPFPTYPRSFLFNYNESTLITSIASFEEMYKILEALENICIGIIDVTGQLTMAESQVFAKSNKLFSAGRTTIGIDAMMREKRASKPIEPNVPLLRVKGKKYEEGIEIGGDTLAAES